MAQNNESGLVLNTVQFDEEPKTGKLTNARNGPLIQACTTMFYEVSNKHVKNDTLINNQHMTWRESRDGFFQIC